MWAASQHNWQQDPDAEVATWNPAISYLTLFLTVTWQWRSVLQVIFVWSTWYKAKLPYYIQTFAWLTAKRKQVIWFDTESGCLVPYLLPPSSRLGECVCVIHGLIRLYTNRICVQFNFIKDNLCADRQQALPSALAPVIDWFCDLQHIIKCSGTGCNWG